MIESLIYTKEDVNTFKIPKEVINNKVKIYNLSCGVNCAIRIKKDKLQLLRDPGWDCQYDPSTFNYPGGNVKRIKEEEKCKIYTEKQTGKFTYQFIFEENTFSLKEIGDKKKLTQKDFKLIYEFINRLDFKYRFYWIDHTLKMSNDIKELFPYRTRFIDYIKLNTKNNIFYFILIAYPYEIESSYLETVIYQKVCSVLLKKGKKSEIYHLKCYGGLDNFGITGGLKEEIIGDKHIIYTYSAGSANGPLRVSDFNIFWIKDLE